MNRSNIGASLDSLHFIFDVLTAVIAFLISWFVFFNSLDMKQTHAFFAMCFVYELVYLMSNRAARMYNVTVFYYADRFIKIVTRSFFWGTLGSVLVYVLVANRMFDFKILVWFLIISYLLCCMNVFTYRGVALRRSSNKNIPRTAYVGKKDSFNKFNYFMGKTNILTEDIGFIAMNEDEMTPDCIGSLENLENLIKEYYIDQIYILQKREHELSYIQKYIDLCIEMGVTCRVVVDFYKRRKAYSYVSSVGTYPVITYHTISLNDGEAFVKRFFDICAGLFGVIVTSPIMIVTAIAIKIDSPGPVFFKQTRVGQNGRLFKCWKFRSMYIDAEERKKELMSQNEMQGLMFKMKDDPRVTRVGKFIRKVSIDEFPQFFNVVAGTMSMVGTRPPTVDEVEQYDRKAWRRISIKPGITGMWQVNGRNGVSDFDEVVRLDTEYIDNWSLLMDIKIIIKTVLVVLKRDGAS